MSSRGRIRDSYILLSGMGFERSNASVVIDTSDALSSTLRRGESSDGGAFLYVLRGRPKRSWEYRRLIGTARSRSRVAPCPMC